VSLATELSALPTLHQTAIVAIIDEVGASALQQPYIKDAGVSLFLTRPFTDSDLLDAIVECLAACMSVSTRNVEAVSPSVPPDILDRVRGLRVLIAEDNEVNQAITSELLEQSGIICSVAPNGKRAYEEMQTGRFDLVLMDCQMPEMDGFEATQRIRAAELQGMIARRTGGRIPIIALTANAMAEDQARCFQAGMDDYLSKPLDPATLLDKIARFAPQPLLPKEMSQIEPVVATPTPKGGESREASGCVVLDLPALRNRCRGRVALMQTALRMFDESMRQKVAELSAAVGASDALLVARLAHALKGSAATVGAMGVSSAASALDNAGRAADWEVVSLAVASLKLATETFTRELPAHLETLMESAPVGRPVA
jgi:CheY-like chemotaxis protein